jgi:serine/threonine protein kinase
MDPASWRQAKDVITEALERPASEREAFVRDRCGDSRLSDHIIAMLDGFTQGEQTADSLIAAVRADASDDLEPGTRIGPYVILDRIGRGGMGQVFLGSDPRLDRKVALKCVIRSLTGSSDRTLRILHEARAAARVNHPNVATIHDVIEHENRAFIVMEYVEGETLASRLKRDPLSIDQVITIGKQLASALAAAHAKGVVHRDLKPGNVQLTPEGTAKVLDFGIANAPRAAAPASTTATTQGTVHTSNRARPGTPPYMSPEQLLGRPIDARSDIFSLGVVLFEMATGRRPFPDSDALQVVVAQATGAPRADAIDRRVPRALADVIEKALATDVQNRFQTAAQVGVELDTIGRQLERQREPVRYKLARIGIGMVLTLILLATIGLIDTAGFNMTFGRTGPFAVETPVAYLKWGVNAVLPSAMFMTVAAIAWVALKFVVRVMRLAAPIDRAIARAQIQARDAWTRAGLNDAVVLSQALAFLGIVALVGICWYRWDLISAWGALINSASSASMVPLGPGHGRARVWYRFDLDLLVLAMSVGLYRVVQLRRIQPTREGRGSLALVVGIIVVLVLMNEWPYRVLYHNEFEAVDFAGNRCYITAETTDQWLVFCPGVDPPRNHIVSRNDSRVRRLGVTENVFSTIKPSPDATRSRGVI